MQFMKCHLLDTNLFQPCGQFIQKDCGGEAWVKKAAIFQLLNQQTIYRWDWANFFLMHMQCVHGGFMESIAKGRQRPNADHAKPVHLHPIHPS